MTIDKENDKHIIADEGKVLQRISDGCIMGREVWLGYTYYLNGERLEVPLLELPEHFREIDEEDADDRPVELPEERPEEPETPDTDEEEMTDTITMGDLRKMRKQVEALTTMSSSVINTFALPPAIALSVQELYPEWKDKIGENVTQGFRFRYDGVLYEVVQPHTLQKEWLPSVTTMSLYKVVTTQEEEENGTKDNPILWAHGMELIKDKYYSDKGELYKCIRDSGIPMSFDLKDLVSGGFVELIK